MENQKLIDRLESEIVRYKSVLLERIARLEKDCPPYDYVNFFSSSENHEFAAQIKVYQATVNALKNDTLDNVKEFTNRCIREAGQNPMNCTSQTVNVMQVMELSAWVKVYRELFGWG